jgi:aconitase (EC 4.2.1.3)
MGFLKEYKKHVEERAKLGIPPLPLTADQVKEVVKLLQQVPIVEEEFLMDLLENRVNPGVDEGAFVKASFLNDIIQGKSSLTGYHTQKSCSILGNYDGWI